MKQNARIVLLSLYSPDPTQPVVLSTSALRTAVLPLSDAGFRSLLYLLRRRSLIHQLSNDQTSMYQLTTQGAEQCEALFPCLKQKEAHWTLLIFTKVSGADRGFQYLREQCQFTKAVALTRGVYLFPFGIPATLESLRQRLYARNTLVVSVAEFISGFDWKTINDTLQLWDVIEAYSSISKQVSELLTMRNIEFSWNNTDKKLIHDTLLRFISVLSIDAGLYVEPIPDESRPLSILSRMQKLLML